MIPSSKPVPAAANNKGPRIMAILREEDIVVEGLWNRQVDHLFLVDSDVCQLCDVLQLQDVTQWDV